MAIQTEAVGAQFSSFKLDLSSGELSRDGQRVWLRAGNTEQARRVLEQNRSWIDAHEAVAHYLIGDRETGLADLSKLTDQWNVKTYIFETILSSIPFAVTLVSTRL